MNRTRICGKHLLLLQLRQQSTLNGASSHGLTAKSFKQIPGPKGVLQLPFIGIALQLKPFTDIDPRRFDKRVRKWNEEFGNICKVRFGFDWRVLVFDPDDVQNVFRREGKYPSQLQIPLFETYNRRRKRVSSMTERKGEDWWKLRSPAQKCIARPKPMEKFIPKLSLIADDFVDMCREHGKLSNLPDPLMEYTTESVGMLCFNKRLGCLSQAGSTQNQILMSHVKTFFQVFGDQIFNPIKGFVYFRTKEYMKFEKASDYMMNIIETNTEQCMKDIRDGNTPTDDVSLIQDLLDQDMTESSVLSVLIDLFRGGVESTASSIMFVLYQLAKNPDKQEILFNELKDSIRSRGAMDENSLHNLKYLQACVKESMRLVFPAGIGTFRKLDEDIELKGYTVPAGTQIGLCTGIICKNEEHFPEPQTFVPERWMHEKGKRDIHPFAFGPFGYGRRMCVGKRFAQQEVYIAVAKIIRNFRLSFPDDFADIPITYRTFATFTKPLTIDNLEPRE